jgi:hypothetical protein
MSDTPYLEISEAEATARGLPASADYRRDPDGVDRGYHAASQTFWTLGESPFGAAAAPRFTNLGEVGPVRFQDGFIYLQGNGCPGCGNGFWTEADEKRRLDTGSVHHCPHCGEQREVTS